MKILIIGGKGTIGKKISTHFSEYNEVIIAGRHGGDVIVDIIADDPVVMTASAAMVNGAIHSFVKAIVLEIENEFRINVVSSGVVEDAYEKYKDYFPGHNPIPMKKVVNAYVRSVNGKATGEIIRIYD